MYPIGGSLLRDPVVNQRERTIVALFRAPRSPESPQLLSEREILLHRLGLPRGCARNKQQRSRVERGGHLRRLDAEAFAYGRQRHLKEILGASNLLRQREPALRWVQ